MQMENILNKPCQIVREKVDFLIYLVSNASKLLICSLKFNTLLGFVGSVDLTVFSAKEIDPFLSVTITTEIVIYVFRCESVNG